MSPRQPARHADPLEAPPKPVAKLVELFRVADLYVPAGFTMEPLTAEHQTGKFDCGTPALNRLKTWPSWVAAGRASTPPAPA